MGKKKPDSLQGFRIELQETEREALKSIALSYRIQSMEGWLEVLQNPLKTLGVVTSLACLIEFAAARAGKEIETGMPCPHEWREIFDGIESVQQSRQADKEAAAASSEPITPANTPPTEGDTLLEALGIVLGNLANPNWQFDLGPLGTYRDKPDDNPFTLERVGDDEYTDAPGVTEVIFGSGSESESESA